MGNGKLRNENCEAIAQANENRRSAKPNEKWKKEKRSSAKLMEIRPWGTAHAMNGKLQLIPLCGSFRTGACLASKSDFARENEFRMIREP